VRKKMQKKNVLSEMDLGKSALGIDLVVRDLAKKYF
jgi:hypothetical protein